jgi:hypothetical protein
VNDAIGDLGSPLGSSKPLRGGVRARRTYCNVSRLCQRQAFCAGILGCRVSLLTSTRNRVMPQSTYFTGSLYSRMAEDLHLGGMGERTHAGYLRAVRKLADYCKSFAGHDY